MVSLRLHVLCRENAHLTRISHEALSSGYRFPPNLVHGALTVNADSTPVFVDVHMTDRAVDPGVV